MSFRNAPEIADMAPLWGLYRERFDIGKRCAFVPLGHRYFSAIL